MESKFKLQLFTLYFATIVLLILTLAIYYPTYQEPVHMGTCDKDEVVSDKNPWPSVPLDFVVDHPTLNQSVEEVVEESPLTQEEIELIALVTMAECGGEPEEGQRLVIDTILNRVDSPYFPDTVYDVLYQKNQYACVWNGALDRCYVRDDLVQLIKEESVNRTNSEVVFFRTKYYHSFGVPMFQVGNHYFSKYA